MKEIRIISNSKFKCVHERLILVKKKGKVFHSLRVLVKKIVLIGIAVTTSVY